MQQDIIHWFLISFGALFAMLLISLFGNGKRVVSINWKPVFPGDKNPDAVITLEEDYLFRYILKKPLITTVYRGGANGWYRVDTVSKVSSDHAAFLERIRLGELWKAEP